MPTETFNFSTDYQDLVLACRVKHPLKFSAHRDIFQPRFFAGLSASEVAFAIENYEKDYGHSPSFKVLANYVFQRQYRSNPERAKEVVEYVTKLGQIDTTELDYVVDTVRTFARERAVLDALNKVLAAQTSGKEVEGGIVKLFEEAVRVGTDESSVGLSLRDDVEHVVNMVTSSTYGVKTGFPLFDEVWKTGWAPGWLIVPLAPPKSFKTAFCINLTLNMVSPTTRGTVFYYACEISEELAMLRALFNISQRTKDELFDNPQDFIVACKEAIGLSVEGDVLFKHFAAKTATIADIKAHAKSVMQTTGIKPVAIVIDYAETIRPSNTAKNVPDHRQQADIYTEARAMGGELGCCVIMPDRCNKDAVEKAVPNITNFQGAFEKAGIVDIAIAICGTESERLQNIIRYFILLNRHGPQYLHFQGKVDPETMRMTVDTKLEYVPEEPKKTYQEGSGTARRGNPMPGCLLTENENSNG